MKYSTQRIYTKDDGKILLSNIKGRLVQVVRGEDGRGRSYICLRANNKEILEQVINDWWVKDDWEWEGTELFLI